MRGDLSKLPLPAHENFTGVLYQQGRVRLDQDDNAEQLIGGELRRLLGQDVIGAGVAAVPADAAAGFKVTQAAASASGVDITLTPGRVWVDGLHLELADAGPVVLPAPYFGPPMQSPPATPVSIAAGVRDAVILEVWEEALSAYQDPVNLLESALGGPDTTERMQLNFDLRLYRLAGNEDCRTIAGKLKDDLSGLGKLTVTPSAVVILGGDCPVDTGGGYTGLEHYLYRIEIATPDAPGNARFKYSRFNGGLVGRGSLNLAGTEVTINANQQMINHCGLTDFYLEALNQPGPHQPWQVAFTAKASLIADGVLSLTATTGAWPAAANVPVFFRLWDDIRQISGFTATTELIDGIQLKFDAPSPASGANNYRPGDFWTFPVRAAGSGFDPSVWPNNAPPQGIVYHRAPLAELNWTGVGPITITPPAIEDCRRPFPPLTRSRGCCTYSVGDGVRTFGDFNSIEEAVAALPLDGGEVCLLPGIHTANVRIENRFNIKIHGCGRHSIVLPRPGARSNSVFTIVDSIDIKITSLAVVTFSGNAITVQGSAPGGVREIELTYLWIVACRNGIVVANGAEIGIRWNFIRVIDLKGLECIVLEAEGAWIERNDLGVIPAGTRPPGGGGNGDNPNPDDPCANPEVFYGNVGILSKYLDFVFTFVLLLLPQNPFKALGGIRLAAGAKRVRVTENMVNGGAGDGVQLGGGVQVEGNAADSTDPGAPFVVGSGNNKINGLAMMAGTPAAGVTLSIRHGGGTGPQLFATTDPSGVFGYSDPSITPGDYIVRSETPGFNVIKAGANTPVGTIPQPAQLNVELTQVEQPPTTVGGFTIEEILIERNEISNMGMSGIGTAGFAAAANTFNTTSLKGRFGIPVFQLEIDGNLIHHCMQNIFTESLLAVAAVQGLGGISLGVCDEVAIGNNRIEHCGTSHVDPVVGIFVKLVDHIEVRDNTIINNGPFRPTTQLAVRDGIRGGIVIGATAMVSRAADGTFLPAPDQPAARVQRNLVRQPLGLALAVMAFGPVAVESNFFSSELRGLNVLEILAGTVLIVNVASREVASLRPGGRLPSDTFNSLYTAQTPDGKTLYTDNQVRLGVAGSSLTCQLIASGGDVGYDSNQADYLGPGFLINKGLSFFWNTVLLADSVRASDSRFKEGSVFQGSPVASLISYGLTMNITAQNQGDHCIFAASGNLPVVNTPNQVIDTTFCEPLSNSHREILINSAVLGRF